MSGELCEIEGSQEWRRSQLQFNTPCLWSPGANLRTHTYDVPVENGSEPNRSKQAITFSYRYDTFIRQLPTRIALARGEWFPIPLKLPADDPTTTPPPEQPEGEHQTPNTQFPATEPVTDPATGIDELFRNLDSSAPGHAQP